MKSFIKSEKQIINARNGWIINRQMKQACKKDGTPDNRKAPVATGLEVHTHPTKLARTYRNNLINCAQYRYCA